MPILTTQRYISVFVIFTFNVIKHEATQHSCSSFFDCGGRPCCRVSHTPLIKVCSDDCTGKVCLHDDHCHHPDIICCHNNVCTNNTKHCGCQFASDPICRRDNKYCCQAHFKYHIRKCKDRCENHPCSSDDDCANDECCNVRNVCSPDCNSLRRCRSHSECMHNFKCCDYKPNYKSEHLKACMISCGRSKHCATNEDCTNQCCGSDQLCKDCEHSRHSMRTTSITVTCVIMCIIICTIVGLTCYCRRRGRCVVFKPRNEQEETLELPLDRNSASGQYFPSDQNLPPPPYSIKGEPFPTQQNEEFPPPYRPEGT